ncbi:unnamed protein product, partial [Durusdinium trenchii]
FNEAEVKCKSGETDAAEDERKLKWSAPDHDAEEVEKYAREHPDEDEEGKDAQI